MDIQLPPSPDASRRPPAPGRLELLRTFLNTVDLENGEDEFASPDQLAAWLIERGLLPRGARVDPTELAEAIAFRETLREVLEANAGHIPVAGPVARLNEMAARVPLHVELGDGARLEPERSQGIERAIGHLLGIVYESVTQGTWQRLKVCRNDACRWAFYDSSRNRSGAWCTMAICGNRMKGRAFRRRQPTGAAIS